MKANKLSVFLTLNHDANDSILIQELLKLGYSVDPISADENLILANLPGNQYSLLAFSVSQETDIVAKDLNYQMWNILNSFKIDYVSLVISEFSNNSIWHLSNSAGNPLFSLFSSKRKSN